MEFSLTLTVTVFAFCFALIAFAGVKLAVTAERLADLTGWGQALLGAVFLGAVTSLSGSVLSIAAAWDGHPELAVGNAVGGIAAQTTFLAIADMFYRKANLEHAAASEENLLQAVFLIVMLSLPLLAFTGPPAALFGVHPISFLMIAAYVVCLRMVRISHLKPMWAPKMTRETQRRRKNL